MMDGCVGVMGRAAGQMAFRPGYWTMSGISGLERGCPSRSMRHQGTRHVAFRGPLHGWDSHVQVPGAKGRSPPRLLLQRKRARPNPPRSQLIVTTVVTRKIWLPDFIFVL